jgi:hypothetical protein
MGKNNSGSLSKQAARDHHQARLSEEGIGDLGFLDG